MVLHRPVDGQFQIHVFCVGGHVLPEHVNEIARLVVNRLLGKARCERYDGSKRD
jgi:hypothetical protein